MKIIGTMIPAKFVKSLLLSVFVVFSEIKGKNENYSKFKLKKNEK